MFFYINVLETIVLLYKYDSTLFEACDRKGVSVLQKSLHVGGRTEWLDN